MIEAPEALYISEQMNQTIKGKRITFVSAGYTPHKFAWFYGDPANYSVMLTGKKIGEAHAYGGLIEIEIEDMRLLFGDGMNIRYYAPGEKIPENTSCSLLSKTRVVSWDPSGCTGQSCVFQTVLSIAVSAPIVKGHVPNRRCFRMLSTKPIF